MNGSFDRFGGTAAILAGAAGLLYAISFVVAKNALLYSLFLTLLGVFGFAALVAVYYRLRSDEPGYALVALAFGLVSAAGTAVHGAYDLANAINPPASVPAGLLDLPSQVDPRGLLTFGFTGIGLFIFAGLMTRSRSFPAALGYLGYVSAVLFVILYVGRLIVLDPANPVILVPVLLNGFVVSPIFYVWLGVSLQRASSAEPAKIAATQGA
ncbi:MAG: DUF4386 domain-containing protein [Chloroflexi bacterium]|nr:DUF4386 domain-containing protein [Chloroflexota bacterium]